MRLSPPTMLKGRGYGTRKQTPEEIHECRENLPWQLLLRRRAIESHRRARGDGLLSLRVLPQLVGRAGERLHALESRGGRGHARRRQHRHVQQDAKQLPQMVQDLWRALVYRTSHDGFD